MIAGQTTCFLLVLSISSSFRPALIVFVRPAMIGSSLQSIVSTLATTALLCSGSFAIDSYGLITGGNLIALGIFLSLALDRSRHGSKIGTLLAASTLSVFLAIKGLPS